MTIRLYSYWRSSAAYRVRIALNLKHLQHEIAPVSLLPGISEHRQEEYRSLNPQMLIPYLVDGDIGVAQSQAILEYLEDTYPQDTLLPTSLPDRAAVRSFSNSICCDVHPLNNLRVLQFLKTAFSADENQISSWYAHWVHDGFDAAEQVAREFAHRGPYVIGKSVSLADTCLVPQMYNARRYNVPVDRFPRLVDIVDACNELEPFKLAMPEQQPDSP